MHDLLHSQAIYDSYAASDYQQFLLSCLLNYILCQLQMFIFRASDHQPYLNYSSVGYSIGYAAHVHDADLFISSL